MASEMPGMSHHLLSDSLHRPSTGKLGCAMTISQEVS